MNAYIEQTDAYINSLGLDAYRVGGSVRDELLGRRVKDADYMIRGASLGDLKAELAKGFDSYEKFSVSRLTLRDGRQAGWRVSGKGLGLIEIVLPRTDTSTGPGHRDFQITVDPSLSLKEDSKRRDFTFNALYKEVSTGTILDPTGAGLFDLERGYVRTTHESSFRDDPLRTLRALRFVAVLGYDLATVTENQMRKYAHAVDGLSLNGTSGTVYDELKKLLMGPQAGRALRIARDTGVLAVLLPELAPMIGFEQGSRYHDMTTDEHTFTAIDHAVAADAPLRVRMSLLFHDSGKPATAWKGEDGRLHYYANPMVQTRDHEDEGADIWLATAKRLNVDKTMRRDVETLIRNHMVSLSKPKASKVARARVKFGDEMLRDLYMHRACDAAGKGSSSIDHGHLRTIGKLEDMRAKMYDERVPTTLKDLEIGGKDGVALGLSGRQISDALHKVLDDVVLHPDELRRTREWQLEALARAAK